MAENVEQKVQSVFQAITAVHGGLSKYGMGDDRTAKGGGNCGAGCFDTLHLILANARPESDRCADSCYTFQSAKKLGWTTAIMRAFTACSTLQSNLPDHVYAAAISRVPNLYL